MGKAKKHHYVPKAYLNYFAREQQIYVFDKTTEKGFKSNINDVAERHNYNKVGNGRFVIEPPEDNPLFYEYKYAELIERRIPRILNNLSAVCTLIPNLTTCVLTDKQKYELARMIIVQLLRTPISREYTFELGKPIVSKKINQFREELEQIDLPDRNSIFSVLDEFEYSRSFSDSVHLYSTTSEERIEQFCKLLISNHVWVIYRNDRYPYLPFVTSDHPVIMYNMGNQHVGFGNNGLDNMTTVISMPLTPKYMVSLYHRDFFWGQYLQSCENKCISVDDETFIMNQNFLQIRQCDRQIYTTIDEKNQLIDLMKLVEK